MSVVGILTTEIVPMIENCAVTTVNAFYALCSIRISEQSATIFYRTTDGKRRQDIIKRGEIVEIVRYTETAS